MTFINIDIGNRYIKITEIKNKKNNITLLNAGMISTPYRSVEDGHIYNGESLANAIKNFVDESSIKAKQVVISISSSKIISREIILPKTKKKNINQLVALNAVDVFPVNTNEYILDYTILEEEKNEYGNKYRINMIVVPIYMVNQYIDLIRKCGLKLCRIDYNGNSITHLIKKEQFEGNFMILDLGYNMSTISIFTNGIQKFSKSIDYGLNLVLEKITKINNMNLYEAETWLNNNKLTDNNNDDLNTKIVDAFLHIFDLIERYFDFYQSRNRDYSIDKIYLINGGSNIKGIDKLVESSFNIQTSIIKSFNNINISKNLNIETPINIYSNCIGSSLSNMNLMPTDIINKKQKKHKRFKYISISFLCILAITLILGVPVNDILKYNKEKDKLENNIQLIKHEGQLELKNQFLLGSKKLKTKQEFLIKTSSPSKYYNQLIQVMENNMPQNIFYIELSVQSNNITICGVAKDELTLATLHRNIKNIPIIQDVYVPVINYIEEEQFISFNMICHISTKGGSDNEVEEE